MNQANRYNLFGSLNNGIYTMLFEFQMRWQQADFSSGAKDTVSDLETILRYCNEYAGYKEQFIIGNLIWQEPHIAATLEEDNIIDHKLSARLRTLLTMLKETTTGNKEAAAASVSFALREYIAFYLYQIDKEETVLQPLLWKHFGDTEIRDMEQLVAPYIQPPILANERS